MSVEVFSWSDFGPESKGLDTKKTAELFDSLRFVAFGLIFVRLGCGKTGIRTLGTRKGTTVFETVPIDRSGIFPFVGLCVGSCPVGCRFRRLQGCGLLCGLFAGTKLRSFSLFEKFSGSFFGFFR